MPLFPSPKKPEEVFTPRSADVNESMYVKRPDLEKALKLALRGGMHVVVHGQSGSGKTWLYRKLLKELDYHVVVANLANASRLGSLNAEFQNVYERGGAAKKVGYAETKQSTAGVPGVLSGELSHTGEFEVPNKEPFEACLQFIRKSAGRKSAVLVLDNLESIWSSPELLRELANVITLLDDERYTAYKVRLLIVGVPADLRRYFQDTPNLATVANRLTQIKEVTRLSHEQCHTLVQRGFVDELRYAVPEGAVASLAKHIAWVTDGLPQRLQEYCLTLAFHGEDNRAVDESMLPTVDQQWLSQSLQSNYAVIESVMNERDTKIGRRNQVLYTLGQVSTEEFTWRQIEELLRTEFPNTTRAKKLNPSQILSALANVENNPIIQRSPKGNGYVFADPKYRMALRVMLNKQSDETIHRIPQAAL